MRSLLIVLFLGASAVAHAADGPALYDRLCAACHGADGDGKGPAAPWLWPRPRDLTAGEMKWRSTEVGQPARDEDLAATIRHGVPGAMPAFGAALADAEIAALVAVVRGFAPKAKVPPARKVPAAAPGDPARGERLFGEAGCASCHGAGKLDLAKQPMRRPRAPGAEADALYRSIAFGLSGTAMPGFEGALGADELWALVAYVDGLRPPDPTAVPGPLAPEAVDADQLARIVEGRWPAAGPDAAPFGSTIRLQGEAPDALAPAQRSLSSRQCARCHAKQVREWTGSIHAASMSPGVVAQIIRGMKPAAAESCLRCHAPLAEQQARIRAGHEGGDDDAAEYRANPFYDEALRDQGLTCAACHVRDWTRHGPATVSESLLALPGYPKAPLAVYERSDFCLPCHQLPPRLAVEGRPLLDTYREWAFGGYMARGVQCQHCHMPNREHTFKGVHDPDTFRQGIDVEAIAARGASGVVSVRARLWNVGAGHLLPTTPTPAAWLDIALVDAEGRPVRGAQASRRIGRKIFHDGTRWVEQEDTRVVPGRAIEVAGAWKNGRVAEATHAKITVRVHPDDFYEGFYRARLAEKHPAPIRAMYEAALARAIAARYTAEELLVEIRARAAGSAAAP